METCEICGDTDGKFFVVTIDNEKHTFCEDCLDRGGFEIKNSGEVSSIKPPAA